MCCSLQKQKDEKLAPDVRQCSPVEIKQTTAVNPPAPYVIVEDDKSLYIGRCVRVYWPNEKEWYGGKIESYDADEGTHSVRYDDGDQEDLFLDKEKVVVMYYFSPDRSQLIFLFVVCICR